MNAGLIVDLPHLTETGASGVGLFRTELQFMVAERMPAASEQQALYRAVMTTVGEEPVTFRTLDIGGDKILPYMRSVEEENPALGWRAIRIGLDRPGLLRAQVRALLKASDGRKLRIMFPMVATCDEFARAKALVDRESAYLQRHGYSLPADLKLGVMLEVPSLLFQIEEICAAADFISIGSNDLLQFLFAADRDNRMVAERFDPLSAPALRALKMVVDAADQSSCPVSVCGEIAGHPLEAMALIGLGFRALSMAPTSIGPVKAMLLELDAGAVGAFLEKELARAGGAETLRPQLISFAEQHNIPI